MITLPGQYIRDGRMGKLCCRLTVLQKQASMFIIIRINNVSSHDLTWPPCVGHLIIQITCMSALKYPNGIELYFVVVMPNQPKIFHPQDKTILQHSPCHINHIRYLPEACWLMENIKGWDLGRGKKHKRATTLLERWGSRQTCCWQITLTHST